VIGLGRRTGLAVLAASGLVVGAWALFRPRSFYDSFPGFGRHWVSPSGPFNDHLVTDVGAAYLALTALAVLALVWGDLRSCRLAGIAWAVFSVPHYYFHQRHLDGLSTFDKYAELSSLAATAIVAIWLALPSRAGAAEQ
jgi:hypothetical protein